MNRANLKFTNLSTTTSLVSIRNINESEREGENKSTKEIGSALEGLVPVEVVTKTGSLSTLSLSQTVT